MAKRTAQRKHDQAMRSISRRTLTVWVVLLMAMTTATGLLMILAGRPLPTTSGLALAAIDYQTDGLRAAFNVEDALDHQRFKAIVIHHSGLSYGNATRIGQLHQDLNYGGLGYHFVINNGNGASDGLIEVGYRWMKQMPGVHAAGDHGPWLNQHAIGICMVGNGNNAPPTAAQMQQLVRLVTELQRRFDIPADRVMLHSDVSDYASPGVHFPATAFRQQLLQ